MNELRLTTSDGVDINYKMDKINPEKLKELFDSVLNILGYQNHYTVHVKQDGDDSQNLPPQDQIHSEIHDNLKWDGEPFP